VGCPSQFARTPVALKHWKQKSGSPEASLKQPGAISRDWTSDATPWAIARLIRRDTVSKIIGTGLDDTLQGTAASDIIDGRAGKDKMIGGDGADTYYVDNLGDTVIDNFSNQVQIDTVISTVALTNSFLYVENYTFNSGAALNFTADAADNEIHGGSGNDHIATGDGINHAYGNAGNDTLVGGKSYDTLDGGVGNDLLQGGAGEDTLSGGAGDDILEGGAQDDVLDGGAGKDQMTGGDGSDTYYVDNIGDVVSEQMGGGLHDLINSTITITQLANEVEDARLLGGSALNLTGNALNNILSGNDGANVIDGGAGGDEMWGGKGSDTYIVDNVLDTVHEADGQGIDLVKSSVDFKLDDATENLILTGSGNINGTGGKIANILTGNDGNNTLDGGAGNDTLIGGKGDDIYVVDSAGDKIVETISNAAGGGHDTVKSAVNISIAALGNVEDLVLTGSAVVGKANALDNTVTGNDQGNVLDGGAGADTLIGGKGHDTYYIDNIGDTVVELPGEGSDTIITTVVLPGLIAGVESYTFNTKVGVSFTADDATNTLMGSAYDDYLNGGTSGLDTLNGGAGNDVLVGGDDGNYLVGDQGADWMAGGNGDDTYFVDNVKDFISELFTGGTGDTVHSTISLLSLWDNVENAVLDGTASLNLTGNDLANKLTGNSGANVIDGGTNADAMAGGKGNDTYIVDNVNDTVTENDNEGTDLVKSSASFKLGDYVENLTLTGLNNISGTGNFTANTIIGNDAANVLDGGGGADTLIGGKGDDSYIVDNAKDKVVETVSNAAGSGHDRVWSSVDFSLAGLVNVEDLNLTGSGDIHAIGNALANFIQGNDGANLIDGGKGADQMEGYGGNDTYYIDNVGDQVFEDAGKGEDTIVSSIALNSALSNVENYTFKTGQALDFVANGLDNWIEGGSGNDHIQGNGGHDHLYGNAGNDWLEGGSANDTIDGGAGADKMQGYDDNDQYFVDNAGDLVIETSTGGTNDSVVSTISLAHLFDNVENLVLTGSGNINGAGNALDNIIWGNNGANAIDGGDGKDEIYGQKGNDLLIGGADADTFDFNMKGTGDGHDTIKDFLKAEDILQFGGVGDVDKSGTIDFADLLLDVKSIVDHGAGKAVDVTFNNGAEITFSGCGTGNTQMLSQLVDSSHVHVG
jgi:Ca2+-binding RTX toxin-like protein